MGRFAALTTLTTTGATVSALRKRYIQAADPAVIEARLLELQATMAGYVLTHLDLAGGGHGHVFVLGTTWAPSALQGVTVSAGGDPDVIRLFLGLAGESNALGLVRTAMQQRVADRLDEPDVVAVNEIDTYLAGAQLGTRFMTGIMTTTSQGV